MKIRKAPCRILAMALAVTVFTTSTSLTTLAERGEGYGQAEDAAGAVQTASEAMPEIDSSGSANETFSESRTENSVDISGGVLATSLRRILLQMKFQGSQRFHRSQ
jgi:hypothetical protein